MKVETHPDTRDQKFGSFGLRFFLKTFALGLMREIRWTLSFRTALHTRSNLRRIKSSKTGHKALLLANGPSQELLSNKDLRDFVSTGGDVFFLNHFPSNQSLELPSRFTYVTSDPLLLSEVEKGGLLSMLEQTSGWVFCPVKEMTTWQALLPGREVIGFCDEENRTVPNRRNRRSKIDRPRPYVSWTVLKALAIISWLDYSEVYVIGMDNTYPQQIRSDSLNRLLTLETHAGEEPYLFDRSRSFRSVADYLYSLWILFADLNLFTDKRVVNLDPASLTTVFRKVQNTSEISHALKDGLGVQ